MPTYDATDSPEKRTEPRKALFSSLPHLVVLLHLLILGWFSFYVGKDMYGANYPHALFYQPHLAPAIATAMGWGNQNFDQTPYPAIRDFLQLKRDALPADTVLEEVRHHNGGVIPFIPKDVHMLIHDNLGLTIGWYWKLFGISWSGLDGLAGLFTLLLGMSFYGLLRSLLPSSWSALASLALLLQGQVVIQMLHLRDFIKAPLIVAGVTICLYLVFKVTQPRTRLLLSGAMGALVGFGLGFRTDLNLLTPLFLGTILLFDPKGLRAGLKGKLLCIMIFMVFYYGTGYKIIRINDQNATPHLAMLGSTQSFSNALELQPAQVQFGVHYNDGFISDIINRYMNIEQNQAGPMHYNDGVYKQYGMSYFKDYYFNFAADFVIRIVAAARKIALGMPPHLIQVFDSQSIYSTLYPWMEVWVHAPMRQPWGNVAMVLGVGLIYWRHPRLGLYLLGVFAYFAAISTVQFAERHLFYLHFFRMLPILFVSLIVIRGVMRLIRGNRTLLLDRNHVQRWLWEMARVSGVLLLLAGLVGTSIVLLRQWQQHRVQNLVNGYLNQGFIPMQEMEFQPFGEDGVRVSIPREKLHRDNALDVKMRHLFMFFTDAGHPPFLNPFQVRLECPEGSDLYTCLPYVFEVKPDGRLENLLIVPYNIPENHTVEIRLPTVVAPYFKVVGVIPDRPETRLSLWMNLDRNWQQKPLYMQFTP